MDKQPVVTMRGVDFSYNGQPVLAGVNVSIGAGDFIGVVGPNGGGKTTLLKLVIGLLEPTRGEVRVFGQPPARVRARIGYVAQGWSCACDFPVSTLDVVLMGRLGAGGGRASYPRADREAALWALERVGLADLAHRDLRELSGGQRQRALIARAIASRPELLALDEPMMGVDVAAAEGIYDLLEELREGMTVIMVSHDLDLVARTVTSVLCVNQRVVRHPTSELAEVSGELLAELYGTGVRLVRHDLEAGKD